MAVKVTPMFNRLRGEYMMQTGHLINITELAKESGLSTVQITSLARDDFSYVNIANADALAKGLGKLIGRELKWHDLWVVHRVDKP